MKKMSEAIEIICEALEIEELGISIQMKLSDLEQWDSVGIISLIAVIDDKKGRMVELSKFKDLKTIEDLIKIIEEL
jgi:acyl carrier protein